MSNSNYNSYGYYSSGATPYSSQSDSQPSEWSIEQQKFNNSSYGRSSTSSRSHTSNSTTSPRNSYYPYQTSSNATLNGRPYQPTSNSSTTARSYQTSLDSPGNARSYQSSLDSSLNARSYQTSLDSSHNARSYQTSLDSPNSRSYQTTSSTPPNARSYNQGRRYNTTTNQFSPGQQQQPSWGRGPNYKRQRLDSDESIEPKSKNSKKKKKPLSQNVPSKKDWTVEDADKALTCEKEYNKRHKNQSLIIKFPDLELNKETVSKFHTAIENVHFQQPSTARFCFVTLDATADSDAVICALNKQRFGDGFLTAEYKKDREEDQNIGPEDIDPHTLYVGNLAQEITKEDMTKTYPKSKRIDIGYAKKMKYTRYAFVTFKSVTDSVEAFKKTHSTQMYSKSLIVRFRRLHGTVGMPGESKPQNPPKNQLGDAPTSQDELNTKNENGNYTNEISKDTNELSKDTNAVIKLINEMKDTNEISEDTNKDSNFEEASSDLINDKIKESDNVNDLELHESCSITDSEGVAIKEEPVEFVSPFLPGSINQIFSLHKPKQVKVEVKVEPDESTLGEELEYANSDEDANIETPLPFILNSLTDPNMIKQELDYEDVMPLPMVKEEPDDFDEEGQPNSFDDLYKSMIAEDSEKKSIF